MDEAALDPSRYAGFWVRFFSVCIDLAFFTPVYLLLRIALGDRFQWWAEGLFLIVALVAYAWFFSSRWQASPGMYLLGFHISGTQGERIGFGKALYWGITSTLGWMLCFAGVLYLQTRFDINGVHDLIFSCQANNVAIEDCKSEIERLIGIPYESYAMLTLSAVGLAFFLSLLWALSIALPRDKTGFHNLLCGTRFVKGRP